ncbi:MAG: hypothetical protein ABJG88_11505 [Litorimonas sp.]
MTEKLESSTQTKISVTDIRQGMRVVARLIHYHGDQFWPLMERLKRELRELEDREKLLAELLSDGSKA